MSDHGIPPRGNRADNVTPRGRLIEFFEFSVRPGASGVIDPHRVLHIRLRTCDGKVYHASENLLDDDFTGPVLAYLIERAKLALLEMVNATAPPADPAK